MSDVPDDIRKLANRLAEVIITNSGGHPGQTSKAAASKDIQEALMAERRSKTEIAIQIYAACQKLGAKSDLLQFIGAYGDSKSDKRVLEGLKRWNAANAVSLAGSAQSPAPPGPHQS